ncbi:MAG: flagellar hook assembly protein FlgD [Alphaproteobacteria bacterium]|jgi:flagellar basal-body rod modification protein FlgD
MSASISTLSANAATSTAQSPRLAGDFNTFLTLLTTQIKNQSPTDPLDTNQMTNQLVQFASVEQQIAMNQNLQSLIGLEQASQLTASAPLIGQKVEVEADQITLQSGTGALKLPAAGVSQMAQITIRGSGDQIIRQESVKLGSAPTTWSWNGKTSDGFAMPDGAYKVSVTGVGATGKVETLPFTTIGKVTGAEKMGGDLKLLLGQLQAGFDKLRSVGSGS